MHALQHQPGPVNLHSASYWPFTAHKSRAQVKLYRALGRLFTTTNYMSQKVKVERRDKEFAFKLLSHWAPAILSIRLLKATKHVYRQFWFCREAMKHEEPKKFQTRESVCPEGSIRKAGIVRRQKRKERRHSRKGGKRRG